MEYTYTDQQVSQKLSYYRLIQIDKDGSSKYSDVVMINNRQGKWNIETYPNPVRDELLIHIDIRENGSMNLRLVNQQGQVMRSMNLQKHADQVNEQMNLKGIAAGIYFLEVRLGDSMKEVRKVIKE
jgi:hypothetical protein